MKKFCPNCEELLKPDVKPTMGHCPGCGWYGPMQQSLNEAFLPLPSPKLPYISIDIETTGLVPETCQILEFGAVFDNWTKPVRELPTFHRYIRRETIVGNPFALAMNAEIIRRIASARADDPDFCTIQELSGQFVLWLRDECGWDLSQQRITPAGKNFASFDRQFLKLHGFDGFFHHRTLDPALLYWLSEDEKLPDTKTCMMRAGLDGTVAHTAVKDAQTVVWLVRLGIKRLEGMR